MNSSFFRRNIDKQTETEKAIICKQKTYNSKMLKFNLNEFSEQCIKMIKINSCGLLERNKMTSLVH
jgi:hypothetical protein